MRKRPLGRQTLRVLGALAQNCKYGFDIVQRTGLISPTVYRALRRLEKLGYVRSQWEQPDLAVEAGRPRRRYYVVTSEGRDSLQSARKEALEVFGHLPTGDAAGPGGA